jgi:hypothetical protein
MLKRDEDVVAEALGIGGTVVPGASFQIGLVA